jgi:hypothetical protein
MIDRSEIGQFIFIRLRLSKKRVYRPRFELIRETPRSKRKINDSSYGGKKSRSTLFRRVEGIGSRSQLISGDLLMSLDTSEKVAG